MSLGDAIRGLIDPLDPAVRRWLQRELPRLVSEGYLEAAQADLIARRYGVRPDPTAVGEAATKPDAPAPATPPGPERTPHVEGARTPATVPDSAGAPPEREVEATRAEAPRPEAAPGAPAIPTPAAGGVGTGRPAASPFLADHAVSIVLYLGAFLVVAAVVIFVAYSWGDIGGGAKLAVLALLTAGFLGAAWLCLPRPSVRQAGRTFLALGAILVPANIAATYLVYFEDSPIPTAVFWLLGALISGGLHALLSLRLGSRAYGALAVLAVPVASDALGWMIVPRLPWLGQIWVLGPAAALGLVVTLAAARRSRPIPLVQAARAMASALLPVAFLASLPFLDESGEGRYSVPIALLAMSAGLAWEATRGGRTWWVGAVAALMMTLPIAIALTEMSDRPWSVAAVVISVLIAALVARRLPPRQNILWDVAAIVPALIYPFAAWDGDDWGCVALFAALALTSAIVAHGRRSSLPLYAMVLAVDGIYVRLLDIYGSPDAPAWALGAALWPLGVTWALLGAALPRRLSGPCWLGALVTLLVAASLIWGQPTWGLGIAATGAAATIVAARRLGIAPVLLLAVPWLLLAGFHGADAMHLELHWRWVVAGATGWLLFAVSLARLPAESMQSTTPPEATDTALSPPTPTVGQAAPGGLSRRTRLSIGPSWVQQWALLARIGAVAVAMFPAMLLLAGFDNGDGWLIGTVVAWLDVSLVLAAWATLARSRDLAVAASLAVVPALFAGILRLDPTDGQAYALPIGLYLLAIATVTRRDRRPGHAAAATTIAAIGLTVLLGTGVIQSFDKGRFGYALLTLAEGLILIGLGIATRWRVLVVCGVTGTVIIAMRQLFDAVAALPGWAILGGSGMLLLGIAVALLLARARLTAAGRSVADRWSTWD